MTTRLIVEGGGDGKAARSECRRAFALLLQRCGLAGRMPAVIASGSRTAAFRDFCIALRQEPGPTLLLVDSEGPVEAATGPWQHLRSRPEDGWVRPESADDEHCHLMVQSMETWLLADPEALLSRFGKALNQGALPRTTPLESCPKQQALAALEHATRDCQQPYRKGTISFETLALVEPQRLRTAGPWAARFVSAMQGMARV